MPPPKNHLQHLFKENIQDILGIYDIIQQKNVNDQ